MLLWTLLLFSFALAAGLLGFAGLAGAAAVVAQIFFFVFLAGFLIALVTGWKRPVV